MGEGGTGGLDKIILRFVLKNKQYNYENVEIKIIARAEINLPDVNYIIKFG